MNVLEMARKLGLDASALNEGKVIDFTLPIDSISEFRDLFADDLNDVQREVFSEGAPHVATEDIPAMTQLIDHVFGTGDLTPEAQAHAERIFPVQVQLTLGQTVVIDTDKIVGPSATPYAIIADTLVFKGGSLTVKSTALTIRAGNLLIAEGQGSKYTYHLGIMGVDGTQGTIGPDGPHYKDPGANGADRSPGSPGICTGVDAGGNAPTPALKGQTGTEGGKGKSGTASMPANVIISSFDPASAGSFILQTRSAAGGPGGPAGKGGPGQNGGRGGNGCDSGCEGTDGGTGAQAGTGGDGGVGGNGVDGTNGYAIGITFPNQYKSFLQMISEPAPPGGYGARGLPGPPGQPGAGGRGGKHKVGGPGGAGASWGGNGTDGKPGTNPGLPGAITPNFT